MESGELEGGGEVVGNVEETLGDEEAGKSAEVTGVEDTGNGTDCVDSTSSAGKNSTSFCTGTDSIFIFLLHTSFFSLESLLLYSTLTVLTNPFLSLVTSNILARR